MRGGVPHDLGYFVAATKMALDDSGIAYDASQNNIGLIVTHENPGLGDFYKFILEKSFKLLKKSRLSEEEYFHDMYQEFSRKAYDLQTFMFLFYIAKLFKIHGFTQYLNNACASGLYAFEIANQLIKSGICHTIIIVGGDHPDVFKYLWFKDIGLYSADGIIRPFSKDSNGFVFGEGAVGLVVEDLDHALERNAKIYGEYVGGGFNQEGWKISFPAIKEDFYKKVMNYALKRSGVSLDDIDLIVPHGVGSNITDRFEATAIEQVFKKNNVNPFVTAVKPHFGHNLGGSALLESAVTLLSIFNGVIPKTLNCENNDRRVKLNLVKENLQYKLKNVLKTACGFAGYNAAAIFRRFP